MILKNLFASVFVLCSLSLAGCQIYFGEDDETYEYCDSTGCYWCDDFGCYPEGGNTEGWTCTDNDDCASGCYCSDEGFCEEAGFCTEETAATDCPEGFVCDDRNSCVPDGTEQGCTSDAACSVGSYCDEATGECVDSSWCTDDADCDATSECDESRGTCVPDETPTECQAEVACDEAAPVCDQGTNPGIENGCYTGECVADADCPDGAPLECRDHTTEADCTADLACDPIFRGLNCTSPNGSSCTSGDANCTCETFVFHECVDATAP